ncbi:MAG: DNA polymerase ligase N-terminal domain-containing protein [Bacillota bacterium]
MDRLEGYRKKRDFARTPEPGPGREIWLPELPAGACGRFVIHEHHARRLHWDLRLEEGAVLRSWAIPKGVPLERGVKRLAVEVEDHPLAYLDFAGQIPQGEYGAGKVSIWDRGYYTRTYQAPDRLEVVLLGERVRGVYFLVRTRADQWLIWKRYDETGP